MFKVELVVEDTDDGLDVPSSFSSVLSLSLSLSNMSGLNGGPPLPVAPDTGGKYPGSAPGNKLEAGCLRGPINGCPGGNGGKSLISAAAICSGVSSVGSPVCVRICCCNTNAFAYFL